MAEDLSGIDGDAPPGPTKQASQSIANEEDEEDPNQPKVNTSKNSVRFAPLKEQLLKMLDANPLDFEHSPTLAEKDKPRTVYFVEENVTPLPEENPKGLNTLFLMHAIKKWELDGVPDMSIVVHGGAQHPFHLIEESGIQSRHADFLKSRPKFNDTYFDGQRDPVEGWMGATNAWRNPPFLIGPNYHMPEFSFNPPHTLFVDAALQAQDDSHLITDGDRVKGHNEWIMDAITHQPIGRHAAQKGPDNVFFWDLNQRPEHTPGGTMPAQRQTEFVGNFRKQYDIWYSSMDEQDKTLLENNPTQVSLIKNQPRFLLGVTKPKNLQRWRSFMSRLQLQQQLNMSEEQKKVLETGEVRIELTSIKLNGWGLKKMAVLQGKPPGLGTGDGDVLVKTSIPCDEPPLIVSDAMPMKHGFLKIRDRTTPTERLERKCYTGRERRKMHMLNQQLKDKDPLQSQVILEIALSGRNGREVPKKDADDNMVLDAETGEPAPGGMIGQVKVSLKEMIRDFKVNNDGVTVELSGEVEMFGMMKQKDTVKSKPGAMGVSVPKKEPPAAPKPAKKKEGSKKDLKSSRKDLLAGAQDASSRSLSVAGVPPGTKGSRNPRRQSSMSSMSVASVRSSAEEEEPESEEEEEKDPGEVEVELPMGTMLVRIAIRPNETSDTDEKKPEKKMDFASAAKWTMPQGDPQAGGKTTPSGGGGGGGGGGGAPDSMSKRPGVDDGAGVFGSKVSSGMPSGRATPTRRGPVDVNETVRGRARRKAAVMIESSWRGYLARMRVKNKRPGSAATYSPPASPPPPLSPPEVVGAIDDVRAVGPSLRLGAAPLRRPGSLRRPASLVDDALYPPSPPPTPPGGETTPVNVTDLDPETVPGLPQEMGKVSSGAGEGGGAPERNSGGAGGGGGDGDDGGAFTKIEEDEEAVDERDEDEKKEDKRLASSSISLVASGMAKPNSKESLVYTFAYWIKWKPVETLADQLLLFGDTRNMPALVRNNKLGALVDNEFCATAFDPRLAGDNWCLLVVTNDGTYSRFYIGYSSNDSKGSPLPCRALVAEPGRQPCDVHTVMGTDVQIRRLITQTKGAGLLAQAWIWARDLEPSEIHELWVETKGRYPLWKPGIMSYRPPPIKRTPSTKGGGITRVKGGKKGVSLVAGGKEVKLESALSMKHGHPLPPTPKSGPLPPDPIWTGTPMGWMQGPELPWDRPNPIIEKDNAAMLEVPLSSKLAYQRLVNVFVVLVDYAKSSDSAIVIDRTNNHSPTAELMIEVALRKNGGTPPMVLVMDSRPRLEAANKLLKDLIKCGFLVDEEKAFRKLTEDLQEPRLTEYRLTATDYVGPKSDLRRLVTPAGLAWLRAQPWELKKRVQEIDSHPRHVSMCEHVQEIFREHGRMADLLNDGRPKLSRIWRIFYGAQLYASGTHYIIFDAIEPLAKPIVNTLGTVGLIFMNGSTNEHGKLIEQFQDGAPMLLLESTGGVAQAFAYVMKAVRMMRPRWDIDFVLRLVTEYKLRAATIEGRDKVKRVNQKFVLDNIHLLDKQLARIDLMLVSGENAEAWMRNFGLPEVLMLFETWQRSSEFLLRQVKLADVMKHNAESLLHLFTDCFSASISIPELGLGPAETKVVATAWNRHLMLFNNAKVYKQRAWTMQFIQYFFSLLSTTLSVMLANEEYGLAGDGFVIFLMLVSPIISALLTTIGTRLRQAQKFSMCKMASFEIVSEIYKFRVRAMEYDAQSLARALMPQVDTKKKDEEPVAPVSNKEKDRLARRTFVERVKFIYTNCMESEMSKGTSIMHNGTGGMDPMRLLMDEGAESAEQTWILLRNHVTHNLYGISVREWVFSASTIRSEQLSKNDRNRARRKAKFWALCNGIARGLLGVVMNALIAVVSVVFKVWGVISARLPGLNKFKGMMTADDDDLGIPAADGDGPSGEGGGGKGDGAIIRKKEKVEPSVRIIQGIRRAFGGVINMEEADADMAAMMSGSVPADIAAGDGGQNVKKETLDTTYNEPEDFDDDGDGEGDGGGGEGGLGIVRDNLRSALDIADYMQYRAMPMVTHVERVAPWIAMRLQIIEVATFIISSTGAVFAGVSEALIPFIAITVSIAAILSSFLEFSRLAKQVEAYNSAQRDLHNLINKWDGLTSTERRTRKQVEEVVGTVEGAAILIATALTDAIPSGKRGGSEEGGEEGEGGEDA